MSSPKSISTDPRETNTGIPISSYRWIICALLFFATTINYIDRQILSLLKEMLDAEFHWTDEQFGWMGSAFQGAYGIGLLGFGWFVDRFGTKIGFAVSITAWSVAAVAHALVGSVRGFFVARLALGLGESGNFPTAIKSVAQWFPKKERALATALFNSGSNIGAVLAPATIPFVAQLWSWRGAFIVAGLIGFIWLVAWWLLYDLPERRRQVNSAELAHIRSDADDSSTNEKIRWATLLKYRQTWSFVIGKFLTDPVWWFFLLWLPDYFKSTRNLDIKKSWIHLVTVYSIITVLSIIGGWVTGYLTKRGWSVTRARKTGMFIFALCVLPILFVTKTNDWTAVFLIGLAGAAHQAWSANLFTTVSDMFPKKAVASVVGIGGMAGSLCGMMFPILTGRLLDYFKGQHNATAGYTILFSICSLAYLIAFGFHHLCAPRFEPINLDKNTGPSLP